MILVCCLNVLSINVGALSYGRAIIAHYTSVYGDNVSTSSNGYNATVIVYGNIYCYNTISLIKGICESEWGNSNDVKLIYADAKNNSVKAVKDFADEHRGKFNYCYDTSNAISADMWHYAHMIGINERLTFPVVIIKDSNENIKYISTNYHNEVVIYDAICDFTIISYKAPNSYTEIAINGKQHYSYAYDVLNKVNEQRAEHGLPSLVWIRICLMLLCLEPLK